MSVPGHGLSFIGSSGRGQGLDRFGSGQDFSYNGTKVDPGTTGKTDATAGFNRQGFAIRRGDDPVPPGMVLQTPKSGIGGMLGNTGAEGGQVTVMVRIEMVGIERGFTAQYDELFLYAQPWR